MSATRYGSLSAATRQWLMEHYQEMLTEGLAAPARISRLPEVVVQGAINGELSAIEYLRVLVASDARGLDRVILEKLAKSEPDRLGGGVAPPESSDVVTASGTAAETSPDAASSKEPTTTRYGGEEGQDSPPTATEGTTVGTATCRGARGKIPEQQSLLASDLLRNRAAELARQESRLRKEYERLGQEAKDVRQLRKMVRDELDQVRKYLVAIRKATKQAEGIQQKGPDALPLLGITAEMMGLEKHHLNVLTEEAV
ncbi:hypothetical protein ACF06N_13755 [Streptomyces albidoflavus]